MKYELRSTCRESTTISISADPWFLEPTDARLWLIEISAAEEHVGGIATWSLYPAPHPAGEGTVVPFLNSAFSLRGGGSIAFPASVPRERPFRLGIFSPELPEWRFKLDVYGDGLLVNEAR